MNIAAEYAIDTISKLDHSVNVTQPFVLSVGSTPTAHAASKQTRDLLSQVLHGTLELHAGENANCYPPVFVPLNTFHRQLSNA